jgi:hypothetical protein
MVFISVTSRLRGVPNIREYSRQDEIEMHFIIDVVSPAYRA